MAARGINVGDPRLPLGALSPEQKQSILLKYKALMQDEFPCL